MTKELAAQLARCARLDAAIDARRAWPGCYLAMQHAAAQRGLTIRAWRCYDQAYHAAYTAHGEGKVA